MLEKITEIQDLMDAHRAELALLEGSLAEAKVAAREHVVQTVRAMIDEAGFTPEEILPLVAPTAKGKAKPASDGRAFPTYALIADPSKTYVRGVLPFWMKDAMYAAGLDPSMGADRTMFKMNYMAQVADTR